MTIRRAIFAAVVLLLGAWVGWAQTPNDGSEPDHGIEYQSSKTGNLTLEQEATLKEATREILCYCGGCPPTLVDDCLCGTARALKDEMKERIVAGVAPSTLVAEYIAQYGEQYLAAPPKEGFNWSIWIFPAVAFVVLGILFWNAIQRLTRRPAEVARPTVDSETVDRYREEIERQVGKRSS